MAPVFSCVPRFCQISNLLYSVIILVPPSSISGVEIKSNSKVIHIFSRNITIAKYDKNNDKRVSTHVDDTFSQYQNKTDYLIKQKGKHSQYYYC